MLFTSPETQTDPESVIADTSTGDYTTDECDDFDGCYAQLYWPGLSTTIGSVHVLQWLQSDITSVALSRERAPQWTGKWARAAPPFTREEAEAALTRDFSAQSADVVEGAGFFRSPSGFRRGLRRVPR